MRLLLAAALLLLTPTAAAAAPGVPDPTFDTDGRATLAVTPATGDDELGRAAAITADGRVVVAGTADADAFVVRFTAAGAPDTSWSGDARLLLPDAELRAVVALPDGRVLAAGRSGSRMLVARFTAAGVPDPAFGGGDGIALPFEGEVRALAVDADGRLVAAGSRGVQAAVVRLRPDGTPDTSFSADGIEADVPPGYASAAARGLVLLPDGAIVVAARVDDDVGLLRLTDTGALDAGFGVAGRRVVDLGRAVEEPAGVASAPDGSLATAVALSGGTGAATVGAVRVTPAGALDTTFAGDGTTLVAGLADAAGMTVQEDRRVVVAGAAPRTGGGTDMLAARLAPDGAPDTAFGTNGAARVAFPGVASSAGGLAALDGRLAIPGSVPAGAGSQLAVAVLTTERADLAVTLEGRPNPAPAGATVVFVATVVNAGPDLAADVFTDATGCLLADGGCRPWVFGTVQTQFVVREVPAGTLTRAIRVDSPTPDPNPANNTATASVAVVDTTPPRLSAVKLSAGRFKVAPGVPAVAAAVRRGASLTFALSEDATVRLAVAQKLPGRRAGRRCVAPRSRPRGRRCVRAITRGPAAELGTSAGARTIAFTGRLPTGRALSPGGYRLRVIATDAAGNRGEPTTLAFRIVR